MKSGLRLQLFMWQRYFFTLHNSQEPHHNERPLLYRPYIHIFTFIYTKPICGFVLNSTFVERERESLFVSKLDFRQAEHSYSLDISVFLLFILYRRVEPNFDSFRHFMNIFGKVEPPYGFLNFRWKNYYCTWNVIKSNAEW